MLRLVLSSLLILSVASLLPACAPLNPPPPGSVFEDEHIEKQAISRINSLSTNPVHVSVTCFNRRVLLTGEVPSEASRSEIETIVTGVSNVKAVSNELVVSDINGIASRTSDSLTTSDVKFRFINNGSFNANQVKVVTENGTVFLMGTLHRKQAAFAAELASTTNGVKRVVMVFDYLD